MSETGTIRSSEALQGRVRAHARLCTLWMERLWNEGETSPDQGLAIAPGEVRRILGEPYREAERRRAFLVEEEPLRLSRHAAQADDALAADGFWSRLVESFELNRQECDLLTVCLAVALDPQLGRVLAYLADDSRAPEPTAAAAARLFDWDLLTAARLDHVLRWKLLHPMNGGAAWLPSTVWSADDALVLSILEERWVDPALDGCIRLRAPEQARGMPCLFPEILDQMAASPEEITLTGPEGCGRETLAAQFAAASKRPLLAVDARSLLTRNAEPPPEGRKESALDLLVRAARFGHTAGAILYWRDGDAISASDWRELGRSICGSIRGMQSAPGSLHLPLPPLQTTARLEAWAFYSDAAPPAIVRSQRLTVGEIKLVAETPADQSAEAILRQTGPAAGELLQTLGRPYTWDDLVVSPSLHRTLKDFEAQVQLRWQVYEDWGFSRLTHLGQGISALFDGPSGTGKTMAAQVLARSLDLELYRVDLAGVVNKYIGETEKRLREVFDACERSGALLFFDEADALFGSRMQVKDSHDRFANIEIDYLLQRIEQFDGIAILATNRKNDLDSAFLRRLRFVIDFLNPDVPERLVLWQKSLPPRSPSGEQITQELDFGTLARTMELNGAQIKSIALGAAFLARSAGRPIGMDDISLAAQREYAKQGLVLQENLAGALL